MPNAAALMIAATLVGLCATIGFADDETTLPADAVARRDVVYATRATGPVKLDVLTPPGDGPFPVVIWIHGGAWKMGDKSAWPHMNFLVGQGFAVANVGYRFSQVAPFPAQLDDVTAALDYLAGHAAELKLDATRIAVTGESAGGHLAALLGLARPAGASSTQPSARLRAVVDLFGPTDLDALSAARNDAHSAIDELLGGPVASHRELATTASPIAHVAKGAPPFLILHGVDDTLVPIVQSETFVEKLKAADVPVDFVRVAGAGHAGPLFWTAQRRDTIVAFLRRHLSSR